MKEGNIHNKELQFLPGVLNVDKNTEKVWM